MAFDVACVQSIVQIESCSVNRDTLQPFVGTDTSTAVSRPYITRSSDKTAARDFARVRFASFANVFGFHTLLLG